MSTYDLYVHSGPKRKKTFISVPDLPGCIALGDTTDEAIASAPEAIRTYAAYLERHGEKIPAAAPFDVRVAEMRLDGGFIGSGFLVADAKPLTKGDIDRSLRWLGWIHDDLRRVTGGLTPAKRHAKPATGRPIERILSHVCAEGGYLRGVSGASRIQREADEGMIDPLDALDRLLELETERLKTMSTEERTTVRQAGQSQWSARAAVRRMLEHGWEHYLEICRRLGVAP